MIRRSLVIRFDQEGFHCWPDAPDDVSYLRDRHRHLFKWTVEIGVEGSDREQEFHTVMHAMKDLIAVGENQSVEAAAEELGTYLLKAWELPWVRVTCSEDGEFDGVYEAAQES